jgi:hypothetical protein
VQVIRLSCNAGVVQMMTSTLQILGHGPVAVIVPNWRRLGDDLSLFQPNLHAHATKVNLAAEQ